MAEIEISISDDYAAFRRRLREAHEDADALAATLLELYMSPYEAETRVAARTVLEARGLLEPLDDRTCAERNRDRDRKLRERRRARTESNRA